MQLTRRAFVRTLALTAGGLLVPAPVAPPVEETARRLWALDGSMLGAGTTALTLTPPGGWWQVGDVGEASRFVKAIGMAEAARFADSASKVVGLLDQATKDFAVLLSTDPFTVAALIRQAETGAVHHFAYGTAADRLAPFRPYSRRATLMTARSRPSYLRPAA